MGSHDYIVYVVDDDVRMCEALRELFTSVDVPSVTFGSVAALLLAVAIAAALVPATKASGIHPVEALRAD